MSRVLGLELLEARRLLSFDPAPFEQEMLEHLNRMRTDPQGELAVLFTSLSPLAARDPNADDAVKYFNDPTSAEVQSEWSLLSPVQPLAWQESLYYAALGHTQAMILLDTQSHQVPGEPSLGDRADNAGYVDWTKLGENVFAFAESPFHAHSAFAIDWSVPDRGHRDNLVDPDFWEVGIGMTADNNSGNHVGPLVVTQDFGDRSSLINPYLLGVVFYDRNHNGWYDAGEGLGNANVRVTSSTGTYTATSMSAGGYQVQVPDGTYTITASGGGLSAPLVVEAVVVSGRNVKVDFLDVPAANQPPLVDMNGPGQPGTGFQTQFCAGDGSVPAIGPTATLGDGDSPTLSSVMVTLANRPDGDAERLTVDTAGTSVAASYDAQTGVLRLSGDATPAVYEQVLRTLRYANTAEAPTTVPRSIEVIADDGVDKSQPGTVVVNVTAAPPRLSIDDASVWEGDGGVTQMVFTLRLSSAPAETATVGYATSDGTASAGADYAASSGTVTFAPGQTTATIAVPVFGDLADQGSRSFYVNLSSADGAKLGDSEANGQILDDDAWFPLTSVDLVDLGRLDLTAGRRLYRFDIGQAGLFTVDGSFSNPADSVQVKLVPPDRSQPPLQAATLGENVSRIDWQLQPGSYVLEVTGSSSDFGLRLVNLVSRVGAMVTVRGTSGIDHFQYDASGSRQVTIDGVAYEFTAEEARSVVFRGDGSDTADLTGSPGVETATLYPTSGSLRGSGFAVWVSGVARLTAHSGGGSNDVASLYDSTGNDVLTLGPNSGVLVAGKGTSASAFGFSRLNAYSLSGGPDQAYFDDSPGVDLFVATPSYSRLTGRGFINYARGFDEVQAHSSGGSDQASLYGSASTNRFTASPTEAALTGDGFSYQVQSFRNVLAYGRSAGDTALLSDSAGSDVFEARPAYSLLFGAGYMVRAKSFGQVEVAGTGKGFDQARFYDSPSNDTFLSRQSWTEMSGPRYDNIVTNFRSVQAMSDAGGYDVAYLEDTPGDDSFTARPEDATMAGSGFLSRAVHFDEVYGRAIWGGRNTAQLYDSAASDIFTGRSMDAELTGPGYCLRAQAFDTVYAHATAGGEDTALLYDSTGDDYFFGSASESRLWGQGFANHALGFKKAYAQSSLGGSDVASLSSSGDQNDAFTDGPGWTTLSNNLVPFFIQASAFSGVRKITPGGMQLP